MKTLRQLCAALVLTLTLALSAFAGEMSTTVTSSLGDMSTSKTGEMTTGRAGEVSIPVTAADIATKVALNLVQSVLAVF